MDGEPGEEEPSPVVVWLADDLMSDVEEGAAVRDPRGEEVDLFERARPILET